jgi:adenine-specific DNA-methyltransferase
MAKRDYADLTKAELIQLLDARDRRDATRFGLVWEANEIERDKALNQDFVALDLDHALSCGNAPWKNLIIEGDNFDALRYLRMTFAGRVKCIYIDPPYNTGNKDFVYNDHYVDKEDLWRHSKWCEFMFQRLTLAKDLLRQDGVIFVSIDDNEIHTLGLIMQKIFGENNFVSNIIWQKRTSPDARIDLGPAHDFILAYSVTRERVSFSRIALTEKQRAAYRNLDGDERGPWNSTDFTAQGWRPNQMYKIVTPNGTVYEPPPTRCWANVESVFLKLVHDKRIWFGKNGDARPRVKSFLSEAEGLRSWTWWTNSEVGHNQEAKKEVLSIVPNASFDTPKPVALIERIVRLSTGPNEIVLDFFAGSGTTAHAVQKLNNEDGGNRRTILVSSTEATADEPEKNLCRDVCATRVRRVIEGYGGNDGLGGDFAYLRCRRISPGNITDVDHEQVWIALQLTHVPAITPFDESQKFMIADHDGTRLIYVPHLKARGSQLLLDAALDSPSTIVYTWQPELVRQRLIIATNTQIEPVPESLAQRFGLRI